MASIAVESARPNELAPAFRLIFQHLGGRERDTRVANALEMVRQRSLDPAGVLVARQGTQVIGAMICSPAPGASGIAWPPQVADGPQREVIEDLLTQQALAWLRQRGAELVQCLMTEQEVPQAAPLQRNGFRHITCLWYLRHHLELTASQLRSDVHFQYETYAECDRTVFHNTLVRTYEQTLDCPEVNGVRTVDQIIEGHRSQGVHDPGRWWLAQHGGAPVGVLLMTHMPEWGSWDIAYVGVIAPARGHGFGRELTLKALYEARAAEQTQVTLAVDARNRPAWDMYRTVGFETYDRREVFLAIGQ
jgi:mycothiol synthase